jgi:hypothetical protein
MHTRGVRTTKKPATLESLTLRRLLGEGGSTQAELDPKQSPPSIVELELILSMGI